MIPSLAPRIEFDGEGRKIYRPDGLQLRAFLRDRSHVSIIRGPIGSGTSSACCQKIYMLAISQRPNPVDGVRRSRWVVVRNSYPELKGTTIKTWLDWFPEETYGRFYWDRPFRHLLRIADVEAEVWFLALDNPDDVRKLRSLELTGGWVNELEFIVREIFEEIESRTGRFPAVKDGGCSWDGVIADMNAPNEDHWVPLVMGEIELPDSMTEEERLNFVKPDNWAYFVQPPAMLERKDANGTVIGYDLNPDAENLIWLKPGYYQEKVAGKKRSWVKGRVLNLITIHVEGEAVWKHFSEERHVARTFLRGYPEWKLVVGLDFGRNPAAVFGQLINQRWVILRELIGRNESSTEFAPKVKRLIADVFPDYDVVFWGDPKGQDKTQADEQTAYDIFAAHGMTVRPAPVKQNNILTRLEAGDYVMMGMLGGSSRLQISPVCRVLKVACAGGYHFARVKGTARHKPEPEKDSYGYSDIADAFQYLLLGGGEGRAMVGRSGGRSQPVDTRVKRTRRRFAAA